MRKQKYNDYQKHKLIYEELAEKRAIEMLGLSEKEILIAKAYETTKVVELNNLKREARENQNKYIKLPSFWSFLFNKG